MFFWNFLAFFMIQQMLSIWSLVPLSFLNPAWILEVLCSLLQKPSLEHFEHYFASMWDECKGAMNILWHCLSLGLEWKLIFPSPVATAQFSKSVDHIEFTVSSFRIWNSSAVIPSPPLALFAVILSKAHLTSHSRILALVQWSHHCGHLGH